MRVKPREDPRTVREWLEQSGRAIGAVVHTIENGKPVKATRLEDGTWEIVPEPWEYGKG